MKLSIIASTVFITAGLAKVVRVDLEKPLNWVAGQELSLRKTCDDLRAPYHEFTAETWAAHVLQVCQSTNCGCTTALGYSIPVFNGLDDREWAGEMFHGASTTKHNYIRFEPIQDSIAYTLRKDE